MQNGEPNNQILDPWLTKTALCAALLLPTGFLGCGNDDDEADTETDTDTDTETDTETDTGTGVELPPDLGVCEANLTDIDAVLDELSVLEIDEFIEAAYGEMMKRSPQTAQLFGMSEYYEIDTANLDDLSFEYELQTFDLVDGMIVLLGKYDTNSFTPEQRIEFESFGWFLNDVAKRRDFADRPLPFEWEFEWGLAPVSILDYTLNQLFEIQDLESAQTYIELLDQVDDQFACYKENLTAAAAQDLLPDQETLYQSGSSWGPIENPGQGESVSYYTTLEEALAKLTNITDTEKQELLASALDAIETSVIPAHVYLENHVGDLMDQAPADEFIWVYPDGDVLYEYLLSHYIGEDWIPPEAHQHGLDEVARLRGEMDVIFESLGYPDTETLTQLYDRVAIDGGTIPQKDVMAAFQAIVDEAESRLDEAFDIVPTTPLLIVDAGYFAYGPSPDGIVPGEYYVNAGMDAPAYMLPTVSYHEVFPGHHMQISIAFENDQPYYRPYWLSGYTEGWGLYAETMVSELGWYDDEYQELGRLQDAMLRALRVVADTALHYEGWSIEETTQYFQENIGYSDDDVFATTAQSEINRALRSPGNVPGYNIGMNKFLSLRQTAMDGLGDAFDIKTFHHIILVTGELPGPALDFMIQNYVDTGKAPNVTTSVPSNWPIHQARNRIIID